MRLPHPPCEQHVHAYMTPPSVVPQCLYCLPSFLLLVVWGVDAASAGFGNGMDEMDDGWRITDGLVGLNVLDGLDGLDACSNASDGRERVSGGGIRGACTLRVVCCAVLC